MSEYQLDIKQVVDYPRCWIYRQFIQNLMADRSIRTGGGSTLFYYTVLCNYANFRTSYLRIDGIGYTVYPGEWICTVKELSAWFRTRFQCQAVSILDELQKRHLISYLFLDRGKVVKYKIPDWKKHNTVSDYNCPCQKDTGFFFMPTVVATELVSAGRCSEMDILLDLCMSAVYNDSQVQGSEIGPVVYLHNGTGSPLVACSEMAVRWGISKATTGRVLKKFIADNPLYHDTWKLLKKYRDVVWSLELSVQQVRSRFEIEYGSSIEDFLESVYVAGIDLSDRSIEHHAKCIERSHRMLKLLDISIDLLRTKHKNGENYYWLLYYSFLSPQQLRNVEDIIEKLRPHIRDISFHTYYRRRREAIDALSSILWGGIRPKTVLTFWRSSFRTIKMPENRYDAIQEIAIFCRYTRDHDKRNIAENLLKKLLELSENDCRELICDIQKDYHLPWKARTVGEMIAVARQESGAQKLEGHDTWHWNALTRR